MGRLWQHLFEHRREIWSDTSGHVPTDTYGDDRAQADTYTEAAPYSGVAPVACTHERGTHDSIRVL